MFLLVQKCAEMKDVVPYQDYIGVQEGPGSFLQDNAACFSR